MHTHCNGVTMSLSLTKALLYICRTARDVYFDFIEYTNNNDFLRASKGGS